MALTMLDKHAESSVKMAWPAEIAAEFEREKNNPNPCVGNALVSETERVRVWTIRLKPGERIGFHRHVLDYFWTAVTGLWARPVQGPRSRESRRQGHGVHDHRVPAKRQQADGAARRRAAAGRSVGGSRFLLA